MGRLLRMLKRLFLIVLVLLLILALALGGMFTWLVVRGFPQREGVANLPGLSAPVRIVRDQHGIPNIYADTTEDLFVAQGYVHASERMWQMDVWRHIGSGRLSELFGDSQVDTDKYIRTLSWRRAAESDWTVMSNEGRTALEAYARGVNAWLDQHGDLPLPFVIAGLQGAGGGLSGYRPEPWTPIDTLAWQKVQAWSLGANMGSEVLRLLLLERGLTTAQIDELTPPYDPTRPVVAPGYRTATTSAAPGPNAAPGTARPPLTRAHMSSTTAGALLQANDALRATIAMAGAGASLAGSNAFAVSPGRSATDGALLANDPHLDISMPSVWFLVGLHCQPAGPKCPYELAGAGFPGVPGIVLGHNARVAWGLTNVGPDVQDLFEETVDPADDTHYLYKGESHAFDIRNETIKVSGGDPVTVEVRSTVHGPVVSDFDSDLQPKVAGGVGIGREGYVYSLAWAATMEPDRTLDSVLAVNRAQNWTEFRDALRNFGAPSQTFMYADVDGNIGVQIPGWMPIRAGGDGNYPATGEDGSQDWTGFIPFDELPFVYNPPDGLIVAANNMPADPGYTHFLGDEFDPGFRAARIHELLDSAGPITTDSLRSIQGDVKLTRAAPVIDALASVTAATADGELLRQRITSWRADMECGTDSAGCAAYETFEYRLLRAVFDDELGAGAESDNGGWRYVGTEPSHEFIGQLVAQPASAWWDDTTTTSVKETRDQVLAKALDDGAADLRSSLGDPANWTWAGSTPSSSRSRRSASQGLARWK